ncbi:hypothetical protein RFI_03180 [Reticulomyxa filosa]|uniref:Uncharacterized protein n=1 Tax=Reticulomyxa filosa TaxID=46433 RepID=X6P5Y3_RETFI|nr:hypothetical protein RFI_03180 [Reticulomyxa filosa]|eukprot:ETO33915.1 hypothetical protein RFI_03180 [Reticulomyxa filosa]
MSNDHSTHDEFFFKKKGLSCQAIAKLQKYSKQSATDFKYDLEPTRKNSRFCTTSHHHTFDSRISHDLDNDKFKSLTGNCLKESAQTQNQHNQSKRNILSQFFTSTAKNERLLSTYKKAKTEQKKSSDKKESKTLAKQPNYFSNVKTSHRCRSSAVYKAKKVSPFFRINTKKGTLDDPEWDQTEFQKYVGTFQKNLNPTQTNFCACVLRQRKQEQLEKKKDLVKNYSGEQPKGSLLHRKCLIPKNVRMFQPNVILQNFDDLSSGEETDTISSCSEESHCKLCWNNLSFENSRPSFSDHQTQTQPPDNSNNTQRLVTPVKVLLSRAPEFVHIDHSKLMVNSTDDNDQRVEVQHGINNSTLPPSEKIQRLWDGSALQITIVDISPGLVHTFFQLRFFFPFTFLLLK